MTPARRTNLSGAETKDRILDAALAVVRADGMLGVSARKIARAGDFNQALVFYHFGTVDELMLAALERAGERRLDRHRARLEAVTDLRELVRIASELHAGSDDPDSTALAAITGAWSQSSDLGPRIMGALQPWNDLVGGAVRRTVEGTPLAQILPAEEIAHAIAALFLGIEVFDRLDPNSGMTRRLFTAFEAMAMLLDPMLESLNSPSHESY